MSYELVASGGILDAGQLASYEGQLPEGGMALLEFDLRASVSNDILSNLENQLKARGIPDVRVESASPLVRVYFRKGFPWLAVLAAVILGLIVLAILIVGWRLYKELVESGIPVPVIGSIGIGLIIVIGLVILLLLRRR